MKIEINLLPKSKKEEIARAKKFRTVLGWEAVIFSMGVVFLGFIFAINYLLGLNLQLSVYSKNSNSSGAQYQTMAFYENKFSEINTKLTKISSVASSQIYWSGLFSRLDQSIPDNVEISGLSTKNFSVYLAGKAKTREDLLLLRDKLSQEDCFENVNLPLSDLVSKEDIAFQIDLDIKESCIKNK